MVFETEKQDAGRLADLVFTQYLAVLPSDAFDVGNNRISFLIGVDGDRCAEISTDPAGEGSHPPAAGLTTGRLEPLGPA